MSVKQHENCEDSDSNKDSGDAIGETAYSQRFVLTSLVHLLEIKESNSQESIEDFIENELCMLWDMTSEKEVVMFLMKHNALGLFLITLKENENARLNEVILGIIANMCCFSEMTNVLRETRNAIEEILQYINSPDARIVTQVLRFVFSNVYYDNEVFEYWLNIFTQSDFPSSIIWILKNSSNTDVLMNSFETMNCICSACDDNNKSMFVDIFLTKDLVDSTVVGFEELQKLFVESPNTEMSDRVDIIFLATHSTLSGFNETSKKVYQEVLERLLKCINDILCRHINSGDDIFLDIVEYATTITSMFNNPAEIATLSRVCIQMTSAWLMACSNDNHWSEESKQGLTKVLPEFFIRTIPLLPKEEQNIVFEKLPEEYLTKLCSEVDAILQSQDMTATLQKVPCIIREYISHVKEK